MATETYLPCLSPLQFVKRKTLYCCINKQAVISTSSRDYWRSHNDDLGSTVILALRSIVPRNDRTSAKITVDWFDNGAV